MLWTLLIWVIVGFAMSYVWAGLVFVRAFRNNYDIDLYDRAVEKVLDEMLIGMYDGGNKIVFLLKWTSQTIAWPAKLMWLTKTAIPVIDEVYTDLVLGKSDRTGA